MKTWKEKIKYFVLCIMNYIYLIQSLFLHSLKLRISPNLALQPTIRMVPHPTTNTGALHHITKAPLVPWARHPLVRWTKCPRAAPLWGCPAPLHSTQEDPHLVCLDQVGPPITWVCHHLAPCNIRGPLASTKVCIFHLWMSLVSLALLTFDLFHYF